MTSNELEDEIKKFVEQVVEPRIPKGTALNLFKVAKRSFVESYKEQIKEQIKESELYCDLVVDVKVLTEQNRELLMQNHSLSAWVERLKEYKDLYDDASAS